MLHCKSCLGINHPTCVNCASVQIVTECETYYYANSRRSVFLIEVLIEAMHDFQCGTVYTYAPIVGIGYDSQ